MFTSCFSLYKASKIFYPIKIAATLWLVQICTLSSLSASVFAQRSDVVIATYQYPGIDRAAAILPISNILEKLNYKVRIRLAKSPTELATLFANGEVDVIVPNLSGFAAASSNIQNIFLVAVPDNIASEYTSSIVSYRASKPLGELLAPVNKTNQIAMVWPDSVSGATIANIYLETLVKSKAINKLPETVFVNSHENVLKAVSSEKYHLGVVATQAYQKHQKNHNSPQLHEIWRSAPIPFGPTICQMKIVDLCKALQNELLNHKDQQERVLEALKVGWPEFVTSTKLVKPNRQQYSAIARNLNQQ